MPHKNKVLENKINLSWNKMTDKERGISKKILENSIDIYQKSITALSKELNCSVSAVNRWAVKLGFDGYKGLHAILGVQGEYIEKYGEMFSNLQKNLIYSISTTEHFLNYKDLDTTSKKIIEKKKIIFYGEAFTYYIGEYFSHMFNKIGINSKIINAASELSLINGAKDSVNIFISISGKNPNIMKAYEKASSNDKIFVTSISANPKGILSDVADCLLISDFYQGDDINPYELPTISKMSIDYVLIKLFHLVFLLDDKKNKELIKKDTKEEMYD